MDENNILAETNSNSLENSNFGSKSNTSSNHLYSFFIDWNHLTQPTYLPISRKISINYILLRPTKRRKDISIFAHYGEILGFKLSSKDMNIIPGIVAHTLGVIMAPVRLG